MIGDVATNTMVNLSNSVNSGVIRAFSFPIRRRCCAYHRAALRQSRTYLHLYYTSYSVRLYTL